MRKVLPVSSLRISLLSQGHGGSGGAAHVPDEGCTLELCGLLLDPEILFGDASETEHQTHPNEKHTGEREKQMVLTFASSNERLGWAVALRDAALATASPAALELAEAARAIQSNSAGQRKAVLPSANQITAGYAASSRVIVAGTPHSVAAKGEAAAMRASLLSPPVVHVAGASYTESLRLPTVLIGAGSAWSLNAAAAASAAASTAADGAAGHPLANLHRGALAIGGEIGEGERGGGGVPRMRVAELGARVRSGNERTSLALPVDVEADAQLSPLAAAAAAAAKSLRVVDGFPTLSLVSSESRGSGVAIGSGFGPGGLDCVGASPLHVAAFHGNIDSLRAMLVLALAEPGNNSILGGGGGGRSGRSRTPTESKSFSMRGLLGGNARDKEREKGKEREKERGREGVATGSHTGKDAAATGGDWADLLDLEATDALGLTPLALAALKGQESAVAELLSAGADPNCCSAEGGVSGLALAVEAGHARVAGMLLAAGASPDLPRCATLADARAPLSIAAAAADANSVEALLKAGAAADGSVGARGESPLHAAVDALSEDSEVAVSPVAVCCVVRLLLEAGSPPNLPDTRGLSPLHRLALQCYAAELNRSEVSDLARLADLLCRYGARTVVAAHTAPPNCVRLQLTTVAAAAAAAEAAYLKATHAPLISTLAQLPAGTRWLLKSGWQPDSDAQACTACGALFDANFRHHHCRLTGRVVCAKCSSKHASLGWADSGRPVRVCDHAYNALLTAEAGHVGSSRSQAAIAPSSSESSVGKATNRSITPSNSSSSFKAKSASEALFAGARPSVADERSDARGGRGAKSAAAASAASSAASETISELRQRGEKVFFFFLNVISLSLGEVSKDQSYMSGTVCKHISRLNCKHLYTARLNWPKSR